MNKSRAFQILFPVDVENGPSGDDIEDGLAFNEFWAQCSVLVLALAEDDEEGLNRIACECWNLELPDGDIF